MLAFQNGLLYFKNKKTQATENLSPYLKHLTLTHLALNGGVILCYPVQIPFFEIKGAPLLAWCLSRSFPSCDLGTRWVKTENTQASGEGSA